MRPPTPDEQIQFLANLQRLLDEGQFVASYKFALLLWLADLSVEKRDDTGSPLTLDTDDFIRLLRAHDLPRSGRSSSITTGGRPSHIPPVRRRECSSRTLASRRRS